MGAPANSMSAIPQSASDAELSARKNAPYEIEKHKHIVAAWSAATGARASKLCRFKVEIGVAILHAAGFDIAFATPNHLPERVQLDATHLAWREAVIRAAEKQGLTFTHGVAAKLINCYLKVRFVCGGHHEHERVRCLHPPIDAVLLNELAKRDVGGFKKEWRRFHGLAWSKFDSATYQSVIDSIRQVLPPGEPLWKIEEHWPGHQ